MKKRILSVLFAFVILLSLAFISAATCNLDVSMINQDPYPAIPGDYVKVVFQIDGVENPECGKISFELLEQYPLIFDPTLNPITSIDAGAYHKDYSSFLIAPYKVRLDENALDGDTPIEIQYKTGFNQAYISKQFNLNVEDSRADFEVYIKEYNPTTKEIIFEILNTAKSDVQSLTVEIPKQNNIVVKGSNTNIVGDLDSNDYTTASFEAVPSAGEITLKIAYTDTINQRRYLEKTITFEPDYFQDRTNGKAKVSTWLYLFWILLIFVVVRYFYTRHKRKKKLKEKRK